MMENYLWQPIWYKYVDTLYNKQEHDQAHFGCILQYMCSAKKCFLLRLPHFTIIQSNIKRFLPSYKWANLCIDLYISCRLINALKKNLVITTGNFLLHDSSLFSSYLDKQKNKLSYESTNSRNHVSPGRIWFTFYITSFWSALCNN